MSELKKCPKCNTPMEETSRLGVPLKLIGLGQKPISTEQGIAVIPFHCLECRYVELYSTAPIVKHKTIDDIAPVTFQREVKG